MNEVTWNSDKGEVVRGRKMKQREERLKNFKEM
jgi:hypothetical protein